MEQHDRVPPEDDYLAPPDRPITQEPQQARRRIVLALVCFLTLPLCACSISTLLSRPSIVLPSNLVYAAFGLTFSVPLFILGRYQNGYIKSSLVWAALGLLGLSVTLIVIRIMLGTSACCGG